MYLNCTISSLNDQIWSNQSQYRQNNLNGKTVARALIYGIERTQRAQFEYSQYQEKINNIQGKFRVNPGFSKPVPDWRFWFINWASSAKIVKIVD